MERRLKDKLVGGRFEGLNEVNSNRMRAVRSTGNRSTEKRLRALLVRSGVRGWKVHPRGVVGRPDFFFPRHRLVVFVDGCFWHGCPKCGHVPRANNPYWKAKIEGNRRRDREHDRRLQDAGLNVLRVWEHELFLTPSQVIGTIKAMLAGGAKRG